MKRLPVILCLLSFCCHAAAAQVVTRDTARTLLGVTLGAEASAWLEEVEGKLGQEVYAEFAELDAEDAGGDYTLGASYLTRAGVAVLRVDESFRARGFPLFLFSPTVQTRRGPAQDTEQEHVNDLVSLIEHRVFAPEMRRTGFDRLIDLTNGLDAARRRGRTEDGQAEMLNYARAALEWDDAGLVERFAAAYRANGWTRSLEGGRRLADIVRASDIRAPAEVAPVFLRCMAVLYDASFRVEPDRRFPLSKVYPQMLIYAERPRRRPR